MKTSAVEKQPGERVDITVSTKPSSNVCLLGVDQSVTLLKTGEFSEIEIDFLVVVPLIGREVR